MKHAESPAPANDRETLLRAEGLYEERLSSVYRRRDQVFVWLFVAQWIFAIAIALFWSPLGWAGKVHSTHVHVYFAVFFGAALTVPTVFMVRAWPGTALTRYTIAVLQMMWSALLIHLSGGRIETHFHVFGSLAFLAFYRDWKVLVPATLAVAGDHLLRGLLWPESVYGIANPEWWRFLEHAFWVVFENVVLVMGILESRKEMHALAEHQANLENLNRTVEQKVVERTNELGRANASLVEASRKAGMADVATSVLHNVGNVLNSVNVSASVVADLARASKGAGLKKAIALLQAQPDPGRFLTEDPRGRKLIDYLTGTAQALDGERERSLDELAALTRNIDHIKVIVSMQQSHAKSGGAIERLMLPEVLDDALKFNAASYDRHAVEIVRDYGDVGSVEVDRHKLFQIIVNLLSNAKYAVKDCAEGRRLTLRIRQVDDDRVAIVVEDNGVGIPAENIDKIFNHGFTTKPDGHGFGLHSSACAAAQLGGSLGVRSDGVGSGATFTLIIPRVHAVRATMAA
jgi:signal transduction histidine kinase